VAVVQSNKSRFIDYGYDSNQQFTFSAYTWVTNDEFLLLEKGIDLYTDRFIHEYMQYVNVEIFKSSKFQLHFKLYAHSLTHVKSVYATYLNKNYKFSKYLAKLFHRFSA